MSQSTMLELTATEARDRMVQGDFTAEAYTQACLDQIKTRDGDIEAWAHLDPAHALAQVIRLAPTLPRDHLMVINMCGRGDKDVFSVAKYLEDEL